MKYLHLQCDVLGGVQKRVLPALVEMAPSTEVHRLRRIASG